jgi:hypothetical protein
VTDMFHGVPQSFQATLGLYTTLTLPVSFYIFLKSLLIIINLLSIPHLKFYVISRVGLI